MTRNSISTMVRTSPLVPTISPGDVEHLADACTCNGLNSTAKEHWAWKSTTLSNKQQAVLPLISVQLATLRNAFQRNAQGSHQTASPNNTLSALHALGWTCILEGYSKLFMTNCQINEQLLLKKLDSYYFIALGSEAMALHSCQAARIHMDIGII